jgi:hypothetical protein
VYSSGATAFDGVVPVKTKKEVGAMVELGLPKGLVFHDKYVFEVMVLDKFRERLVEELRSLSQQDIEGLVKDRRKLYDWVVDRVEEMYEELVRQEDCVYTVINVAEVWEENRDWVCLDDSDEFIPFCKRMGYVSGIVYAIEQEMKIR